MLKGVILKSALVCASLVSVLGSACISGPLATRDLDREYDGITALPVARYLGLDDSCNGRRLTSIVLYASSSAGPGYATLIVNGKPVGASQILDATVSRHEFKLDPDYNYIGSNVDIHSMEVRLSGNFYIEHVEGNLSEVVENLPWSNWGVLFDKVALKDQLSETTIELADDQNNAPERVLFVARDEPVYLHRVTLNFTDGTTAKYGAALIGKNEARRVDINHDCHCKHIKSITVVARAGENCETAGLEVRGKRDVDDDGNALK